jgi:ribosomal protein S18 acetylase RimI-like enzyme
VTVPQPPRGGVIVRAATGEDAAGIARVHIRSFLATYPQLPRTRRATETGLARRVRTWERRLREPGGCSTYVATGDHWVCGFVHLGLDPDRRGTGQVLSIHVDPGCTGHGIGARLMASAVAALRTAGNRSASLWVVANNERARAFYERLGWRPEGTRRREVLALDAEDGDEVETVRYQVDLTRLRGAGRPARSGLAPYRPQRWHTG